MLHRVYRDVRNNEDSRWSSEFHGSRYEYNE